MAVVTAEYTRSRAAARAYIRYFTRRPERDGREGNRTLFNGDGILSEEQAYKLVNEAKRGTVFFKMVISTDPNLEDTFKDLSLSEVTIQTILRLQERLKQQVQFVAAEHDHTDVRHVHLLALVNLFVSQQDLQALINTATETALFQRQERDLAAGREPQPRQQVQQGPAPERQPRSRGAGTEKPQLQGSMPVPLKQTCPSCGHTQHMNPSAKKHRCHCTACGYQLHPEHNLRLQAKEAGWER